MTGGGPIADPSFKWEPEPVTSHEAVPPDAVEAVSEPIRFDGRGLRSERTRHLIIEAYLLLLQEHRRMPTAAEIAARAGYSVRSIFERFTDLEALSLATADYAIAVGQAEAEPFGGGLGGEEGFVGVGQGVLGKPRAVVAQGQDHAVLVLAGDHP